jgi:phosphatidylglycerol:prolipoprotein diacylglycerol transferase
MHLMSNPWSWLIALPQLWNGGMSFHGGLLGVLCAMFIISKRVQQSFVSVIDFVAPLGPIGLGLGRIGNFINGELWGRPTDSVVGFLVQGTQRHATQLYEATLEGLLLFIILWLYTKKKRPSGFPAAVFLITYGCFRIFIEFFRLPDAHIGYLYGEWLTLGHLLTIPMMIFGFCIIIANKLRVK